MSEYTRSYTARRNNIDNQPPEALLPIITNLFENVVQLVRDEFGPTRINSGYRSEQLNKVVGGSARSQHCLGEAVDLEVRGISNKLVADWIIDNWNEGYAITSATYGNGVWAITMTQGSKLGAQTWKTETTYPFDWIKERADKGYSITTISYGDGMWLLVMSKNETNTTNRSSTQYRDVPIDWILRNVIAN